VSNWYTGRESVKRAAGINGSAKDTIVDGHIEAASRLIDAELGMRVGYFIPETKVRYFNWSQDPDIASLYRRSYVLMLDEDLISLSGLTSDNGTVTIPTSEVNLEPVNEGPPYRRIEIDKATVDANARFAASTTTQQAIAVTGSWGYKATTKAAGALAEADDGTETALDVTNASLIDIGDTILIGTEQMFVTDKGALDTTANTAGALAASASETTVPVNTGTLVLAGEVILIDSERMLVESVSGNNLTVVRAYDGSTLATHANPSDVYAFRTLTVTRAANGTTAASHSTAAAITKYAPPLPIQQLCRAVALAAYEEDQSGWTGQIAGGEAGVIITRPGPVGALWERVMRDYGRPLSRVL
jgi:hypothetical protein